jgi:hypothetical protein
MTLGKRRQILRQTAVLAVMVSALLAALVLMHHQPDGYDESVAVQALQDL